MSPIITPFRTPNLFDRRIAYNPNLLGPWQLTVSNPNYTNTFVVNTAAIDSSIGVPPFITGIAISGASNATTTPTITWNAPAFNPPNGYNQATRIFIVDRAGPGCLNKNSASISGASAGVRPPRGAAEG